MPLDYCPISFHSAFFFPFWPILELENNVGGRRAASTTSLKQLSFFFLIERFLRRFLLYLLICDFTPFLTAFSYYYFKFKSMHF